MAGLGKHRRTRAGLVAGVCVVVAAVGATVASSQSSPAESSPVESSSARSVHPGIFSANIRRGPDRGLAVWGVLSGEVAPSGRIRGALKGNQPPVRVTGSAKGRRVKLVFHLPGGRKLKGTGTGRANIRDFKSIPTNGTFTGPRRRDKGAWDIVHCMESRPGLPGPRRFRCVSSEGRVFYVVIPG